MAQQIDSSTETRPPKEMSLEEWTASRAQSPEAQASPSKVTAWGVTLWTSGEVLTPEQRQERVKHALKVRRGREALAVLKSRPPEPSPEK